MTLENLLVTRQLHEHEANAEEVRRALASVDTALSDASQNVISIDTRFDSAYRAIAQCSLVALWVNGYRPSKSAPGHHAVMIQTLSRTLGLPKEKVRELDAFRTKRNALNYEGKPVDDASLRACVNAAQQLRDVLTDWLHGNRADLIE